MFQLSPWCLCPAAPSLWPLGPQIRPRRQAPAPTPSLYWCHRFPIGLPGRCCRGNMTGSARSSSCWWGAPAEPAPRLGVGCPSHPQPSGHSARGTAASSVLHPLPFSSHASSKAVTAFIASSSAATKMWAPLPWAGHRASCQGPGGQTGKRSEMTWGVTGGCCQEQQGGPLLLGAVTGGSLSGQTLTGAGGGRGSHVGGGKRPSVEAQPRAWGWGRGLREPAG